MNRQLLSENKSDINYFLLQVLGEMDLDGKCVQALDTTRGGQLVATGGQLNSVKTGVIS